MAMRNGAGAAVFFFRLVRWTPATSSFSRSKKLRSNLSASKDLTFRDELVDMLQGGLDALVAVTSQDERQGSAEEFPRIARISRASSA